MSYLRQRSMGKRKAFLRARAMAKDVGKAYVVYDPADRSYHAQTEYDKSEDVTLIDTVCKK
jgi:hypothetical protein